MTTLISRIGAPLLVSMVLAALGHTQTLPPDTVRSVPPAPLFTAHDLLTLTIEAPLNSVLKERGDERTAYDGKLTLASSAGESATFDVSLRTRGHTRLTRRICEFPPLRITFDSTQIETTLFSTQDELKLVTHCQDRTEYEQYVLLEYLAYRILNQLSDISFRVRLARIGYRDTEGKRDSLTRYAFLIEDNDAMAARNGWEELNVPAVPPDFADPSYLALIEVYQYMIGNPDWSAFLAEPDETECCHNAEPIGALSGPVFSVPYDFDITGIVNTRYADRLFQPAERDLGIRSVRQRVYRGRCESGPYLPQVLALFNERRDAIYALYQGQRDLDPKVLEETKKYLDEFYEVINDPGKVKREFSDRCRRF